MISKSFVKQRFWCCGHFEIFYHVSLWFVFFEGCEDDRAARNLVFRFKLCGQQGTCLLA